MDESSNERPSPLAEALGQQHRRDLARANRQLATNLHGEGEPRPSPPEPRHLLAALVRREGRVRLTARELADVRSGKLGMAMTETGDMMVTWVAGE